MLEFLDAPPGNRSFALIDVPCMNRPLNFRPPHVSKRKKTPMRYCLLLISLLSCAKDEAPALAEAVRQTRDITYNNITMKLVIEKPTGTEMDALLVYHGTVLYDANLMSAANNVIDDFKGILDRKDMLIVGVPYPGENMLLGDNIIYAEAALLWVKNKASQELGISIKKIFLGGHSQGGYLVTRLNTMHETNGVIANAPGPFNLVYRCQLEESGQIAAGATCNKLRAAYGTTSANPNAYMARSLLTFTRGFKSDILFVQGLNDSPIQMYSWPVFKQEVNNCTDCKSIRMVEIPGGEHSSLFMSSVAKAEFNNFINSR